MAVAFRWSPLRSDHRLLGWQAFGLLYGLDTSHLVLARYTRTSPGLANRVLTHAARRIKIDTFLLWKRSVLGLHAKHASNFAPRRKMALHNLQNHEIVQKTALLPT